MPLQETKRSKGYIGMGLFWAVGVIVGVVCGEADGYRRAQKDNPSCGRQCIIEVFNDEFFNPIGTHLDSPVILGFEVNTPKPKQKPKIG